MQFARALIMIVGLVWVHGTGTAQVELQSIVARKQVAACEPFYVADTAVNRGPSPVLSAETDVLQVERWEEGKGWVRDYGQLDWNRRGKPGGRGDVPHWGLPASSMEPRYVGEALVVHPAVLLVPARYRFRRGGWHAGLARTERTYSPWLEVEVLPHAYNQERIRPENKEIWGAYCMLLSNGFGATVLAEPFATLSRRAAVFLDERYSPGLRLVATLKMAQVEIGYRQGVLNRGLDGKPAEMATEKRAELRSVALAWYRKLDAFALDSYTGSHGCFAGKALEFKVETGWHVGLKDEGRAAWLSLRRLYPDTMPVQYGRERWSRTYGD